ncbi:MAG: hypothetical protein FJZ90_13540 [Chloroflexi bacterium]|nr:hypothetical protein [Chloroflexota bacterium]
MIVALCSPDGGRELAESLLLTRAGLRVLFASGYIDDAIVHHGMQDEGVALLEKPYTPSTLSLAVRRALDG